MIKSAIGNENQIRLAPMRRLRPRNFHHTIFVLLVLLLIGRPLAAQTPAVSAAQQGAQDSSEGWGPMRDQIHEFAGKVAVALGPVSRTRLAFTFTNVSTLDSDHAMTIAEFVQAELIDRKLSFSDSDAAANLHVTLSQGSDGYLLAAEIPQDPAKHVLLLPLAVPTQTMAHKAGGITLEENLVWQQPQKFVDFALFSIPPEANQKIVILEPERLGFYTHEIDEWRLDREIAIPPSRPRDIEGRLVISENMAKSSAELPDAECNGDFAHPETVECGIGGRSIGTLITMSLAKLNSLGGDVTLLSLQCHGHAIALASGKGDWAQADFIQAYEAQLHRDDEYHPLGNQIQFDGPIISLKPTSENTARAVEHNLETGNYEAYLVTATCSN